MPSSACYSDLDRKSTRLNSSHLGISYAVFCLYKLADKVDLVPQQPPDFPERIRDKVGGKSIVVVPVSEVRGQSLQVVFFFNDTATTEIYTLSLHDALPI